MQRLPKTFIAANGQELPVADLKSAVRYSYNYYTKLYNLTKTGELFTDCFFKVYSKCNTYNPEKKASLKTWSSPIVQHYLADYLKSQPGYKISKLQKQLEEKINWLPRELAEDGVPSSAEYGSGTFDHCTKKTFVDAESVADSCADTGYSLDYPDFERYIYDSISKLNPRYAEIILLTSQHYSAKEIAAELGIKQTTVNQLLFRARESLKRILGNDFLGEYGYAA